MGRFSVSTAALGAGVGDLQRGIEQIEAQLDHLHAYLAPLRATWDGSASDAWRYYERLWDAASADLLVSLGTLHAIVTTAHANYSAAEAANGRIWAAR